MIEIHRLQQWQVKTGGGVYNINYNKLNVIKLSIKVYTVDMRIIQSMNIFKKLNIFVIEWFQ